MLEKFWEKKLGKSVGSAVLFKHNTDQQLHNMNHSLNWKTHKFIFIMYLHIPFHSPRVRTQPAVAHSSWTALPLPCSRPRWSVPAGVATLIPGPCVLPSIQLAATDSILGEQCSALRHPGLGTRQSRTDLVSLWGRTGLHSWVRPALWPQPQLPCHALERPTPPRPPRLHAQQPQAQDGHARPSTNEASWFVFLCK